MRDSPRYNSGRHKIGLFLRPPKTPFYSLYAVYDNLVRILLNFHMSDLESIDFDDGQDFYFGEYEGARNDHQIFARF